MTIHAYNTQSLIPTASKTSSYTAKINDLVIVDGTSSSVAITLPTTPPDLSTVGVKRRDATYTASHIPTVAPGGSDAFLGGSTTPAQLPLQGQVIVLQYSASLSQWIVLDEDEPLSQLDLRYLNNSFIPADYGYISWAYDPIKAQTTSTLLTAGEAYLLLMPIRKVTTITNVILGIGVAGSGLTSGQCFAGLFDKAGNLLSATADQSTNWQSAGTKTMALTTPQTVAPGLYYVGWYANGTTTPKFNYDAAANPAVALAPVLFASPRAVIDTTHTGLTTAFPSPVTLTASVVAYWAAVS